MLDWKEQYSEHGSESIRTLDTDSIGIRIRSTVSSKCQLLLVNVKLAGD